MQKIVDFILKLILVIMFLFVFFVFQTQFQFDQMTINGVVHSVTPWESFIFLALLSAIGYIVILLTPPFNFIVIYLIYHNVVKNRIRKNAKFDKHNLDYCREHLNKMSPEIISYLNNFTIEFEKDISAHILKLLYEGYLIEETGSFKQTDKETNLLSETDLLVLQMINEKDFGFEIKRKYEKAIENEVISQGLITLKTKRWKNLGIKFIVFVFGFSLVFNFIPFVIQFAGQGSEKIMAYMILVWVLIFMIMFGMSAYFIANFISLLKNKTSYIRTSKGNQILKNSWSLEKFLQDFSNLDESKYKEVYTREYFLIYAVVLKVNEIIPKEIMQKVK